MTNVTYTLLITHAHLQTVRKSLVNQLQRAKQRNDADEQQRIRDVLGAIDLKTMEEEKK